MSCIFCQIIKKEVPADLVYEDKEVIAFKDVHPIAPVHILIIPKSHIPTIDDLKNNQRDLAGQLIIVAKKIAENLKISSDGYKLLFRVKKHGGQEIDHLHLHLIGGAPLQEIIRPQE